MNTDDMPDPGEYRCLICHGLLDGFDCPRCNAEMKAPPKWLNESEFCALLTKAVIEEIEKELNRSTNP